MSWILVATWAAMSLAVLGAFLVTLRNRKWHLIAFGCWIGSNSFWTFHNLSNEEWALSVQFAIFLVLAVLGVKTNWQYRHS